MNVNIKLVEKEEGEDEGGESDEDEEIRTAAYWIFDSLMTGSHSTNTPNLSNYSFMNFHFRPSIFDCVHCRTVEDQVAKKRREKRKAKKEKREKSFALQIWCFFNGKFAISMEMIAMLDAQCLPSTR